jgi:hypothetical protein
MANVNSIISTVSHFIKDDLIVPLGSLTGRLVRSFRSHPWAALSALLTSNALFFVSAHKAATLFDAYLSRRCPQFSHNHRALKERSIAILTGTSSLIFSLFAARISGIQVSKKLLAMIAFSSTIIRFFLAKRSIPPLSIEHHEKKENQTFNHVISLNSNPLIPEKTLPRELTENEKRLDEINNLLLRTNLSLDSDIKSASLYAEMDQILDDEEVLEQARKECPDDIPAIHAIYAEKLEDERKKRALRKNKNLPLTNTIQENKQAEFSVSNTQNFNSTNEMAMMHSLMQAIQDPSKIDDLFKNDEQFNQMNALEKMVIKPMLGNLISQINSEMKNSPEMLNEMHKMAGEMSHLSPEQFEKKMNEMIDQDISQMEKDNSVEQKLNQGLQSHQCEMNVLRNQIAEDFPEIIRLDDLINMHIQDIYKNPEKIQTEKDAELAIKGVITLLESCIEKISDEITKSIPKANSQTLKYFEGILYNQTLTLNWYEHMQKKPGALFASLYPF